MKKMGLLVLAVVLLSATGLSAMETEPMAPGKLTEQVHHLLRKHSLKIGENDLTADIRVFINQKGQLVVLSVETDDLDFEQFLKSRLNYRSVQGVGALAGETYSIPIRFTNDRQLR